MREDEVKKRSKETDKDHELRRLKAEVSRLREERDILKKAAALVRCGERIYPQEGYAFMKAHQAEHSISIMSRVLKLSRTGYYAWLKRDESKRSKENRVLNSAG